MDIYHYHRETKELISGGVAREDPLEKGKYLIPANATIEAPPEVKENEKAIFDEQKVEWGVVADSRGTYYLPDGQPVIIASLGQIPPVGATKQPPPEDPRKNDRQKAIGEYESLQNKTGIMLIEVIAVLEKKGLLSKDDLPVAVVDYLGDLQRAADKIKFMT